MKFFLYVVPKLFSSTFPVASSFHVRPGVDELLTNPLVWPIFLYESDRVALALNVAWLPRQPITTLRRLGDRLRFRL